MMNIASKLLLVGPSTFRSFRCIWMLEELNVPYDHSMALPRSKEASKYHPMGKIPSLVVNDGEFCVYESSTINTFLADCYQARSDTSVTTKNIEAQKQHQQKQQQKHLLVPRGPSYERAKYDQTVTFIVSELDAQGLWIHRKHDALKKIFGSSPEAVAEAKRQFDSANHVLIHQLLLLSSKASCKTSTNHDDDDDHNSPSFYLLGSHFTAADILYVHCLEWAEEIGWINDTFLNDNPHVTSYLAQCRKREGYRTANKKREQEKKAKEKYVQEKTRKNQSKL